MEAHDNILREKDRMIHSKHYNLDNLNLYTEKYDIVQKYKELQLTS